MRPSASTTSMPEHQLARVAVAQHRGAAGVGRQVAADRAAAFGRERQREREAGGGGGVLHRGERHAGLDRDRRVGRVERADAVHPRQRHHDRVAAGVRRRAAAQAGVAALRHDRRRRRRRRRARPRRPRRSSRAHDRERPPAIAAAPVGERGGRCRRRRSGRARRRRRRRGARAGLRRCSIMGDDSSEFRLAAAPISRRAAPE